ncbi:MAG: enoyl-CoA hydratase/isomerase family protein [Candidatus Binatia bacterium]|nr:enoyl-CoA hydratase/isomerase family protein [Candidatus Binatia bacterium]MDG2008215.1 enoyl-CoA hydratase/isomerase family protein [Candidatus Binatia bacterium]
MRNFENLEVVVDGARATIFLNEPGNLNPLRETTLRSLIAASAWLDEQPQLKVVVVAGRGRAFCAGADVQLVGSDAAPGAPGPRAMADLGREMADAIEGIRAVTIASIHGHCIGGGVVLASACDLRVAASTASFRIPEVDLGIPLAWGGMPRLVRDIGPVMTRELVLTCRKFTASEAKDIGFLNRVVPDSELEASVSELADELLDKAQYALLSTKRQTRAITAGMVGLPGSLLDADLLVAGLRDPEGREKAEAYLRRVLSGRS